MANEHGHPTPLLTLKFNHSLSFEVIERYWYHCPRLGDIVVLPFEGSDTGFVKVTQVEWADDAVTLWVDPVR